MAKPRRAKADRSRGIGLGRVHAIIEDITCEKAYLIRRGSGAGRVRSARARGLCLGGSSAINVGRGAARKRPRPAGTIVTILADYGTRYQSKLFNPPSCREKGLPVPAGWSGRRA